MSKSIHICQHVEQHFTGNTWNLSDLSSSV